MAVPDPQDPSYESELAMRLLAALEAGDNEEIAELQGQIIGVHYARLRGYVAARLSGYPSAHAEEVFGEAAMRMFEALWRPEKIRWVVTPGRSFGSLFGKIAIDEIANYGEGRRPYKDDKRLISGLETALVDDRHHVDCINERVEEIAAEAGAAQIMEAAGGLRSFDGLLLHFTAVEGISLKTVEPLLILAHLSDREDAAAEAAELLNVTPELASQYLMLIRECPSAAPLSYNALKVAVHRARKRVKDRIDGEDMGQLR